MQRLADLTVKLETRRDRDGRRARAPPADGEVTTRGRSQIGGGGIEEKARAQPGGNELGFVGHGSQTGGFANVSDLANDLFSSLGI